MPFVLYQSDMQKYRPIVHWKTKNTSFIRMMIVLKRMGIKNNTFFLSLFQPELENVDPFDPNLSNETKTKILVEAKLNPWYFFRECLHVPTPGGLEGYFRLSRGNLAAMFAFFNDVDFGLIMPRQTGKSYVSQSIICYVLYILGDNLNVAHFDKDQNNCVNIIRTIKDLRNGMPPWMYEKSVGDTDRKESISYARKNNSYLTFPGPTDERAAAKQGRGLSLSLIHLDEIAFINYNWVVIPTCMNAMLKASEMTRKAGIPSPVIYTTTAGNPDTRAGKEALNIFEQGAPFSEELYDLEDRTKLMEFLEANSTNHLLFLEFSYKQLGYDEKWFQSACRRLNNSQDDINRDLLNIWQGSTDNCVIDKKLLSKIRNSKLDPYFTDLTDGFAMRWYLPRDVVEDKRFKERSLILGMDTSENIGRDFTTFTFVDPTDMRVVSTCRCNDSNIMQIARFVSSLMIKYPKLIWIPERQSTATVIIDFVLEELANRKINPFLRIYNEAVQNRDDPSYKDKYDIYNYNDLAGKVRSVFGYRTSGAATGTGSSRNNLYKITMMKTLEMNHDRIHDSKLISELCGLEVKNGRIDHSNTGHDDQVISYLLACYLIFSGKNLNLYGLEEEKLLAAVSDTGSPIKADARREQIYYRKRIADIEAALANTSSYVLRANLERELQYLQSLIDESIVTVQPVAVSQVKYQEQAIKNETGNSEGKLNAFVQRYSRIFQ